MLKVGLTGGIGSGKSTVSSILSYKKIPVIDADNISRDILKFYPEILLQIKEEFGNEFFNEKGELLRRKLGNLIFSDISSRKKLEDITLPAIIREIFIQVDKYNNQGQKICIIDAPTLIEVGLHRSMDFNILVWVDLNTQIERVKNRDNFTNEEVIKRINSQMPLEEKKELVDFIIDNRGSIEQTKEQIESILSEIYRFEG